ncbi:hypothetical protein ACFSTD_24240 [Novosphingobium colocasiae]
MRMLAVAESAHGHGHVAEQQVSVGDLARLMRIVFGGAAIVVTVAMLTLGTWSVMTVARRLPDASDVWGAWLVIALSSPLRIIILSRLTFLNGLGEIARPRMNDGLSWVISGLLSTLAILATGSLFDNGAGIAAAHCDFRHPSRPDGGCQRLEDFFCIRPPARRSGRLQVVCGLLLGAQGWVLC